VSPGALLLPLGAGFGYACGAIAIKRALAAGVSGNRVNLLCNGMMALFFQLLWLLPGKTPLPGHLAPAAGCGLLFFLGQLCTFRAIASGDVSIATPLLGSKVLLVALFSLFITGNPLPGSWWMASLLASSGIALISYAPGGFHERILTTIGWSFGAACLFALTDVFVQREVPVIGYCRFAPVMFGTTGVLSLFYLPSFFHENRYACIFPSHPHNSLTALSWLGGGAFLLAVQSLGMYSAIGLYGSATLTNILYGSRCLWSVLLVGILGRLDSEASSPDATTMRYRFLGALFIFLSMALVLH
jgi:drug/metabolite transporter (DMT)-like permease